MPGLSLAAACVCSNALNARPPPRPSWIFSRLSSSASPPSTYACSTRHPTSRAGSVGLPLPAVAVKLIDGELYVRGPNVFPGYWGREQATRDAFVDGYFRTGDLAVRSQDGYYTLQGRKSDLMISGGFNIYPREIEEFL